MFIGVDHASKGADLDGRSSVRIESQDKYNGGLFIAKFNHLPKVACGAWPAFWMTGDKWPVDGEIDIYEQWNMASHNLVTLHTGSPEQVGECILKQEEFAGKLDTYDCWNDAPSHWPNQGCGVTETNGQWGKPTGGVYATDWTEEGIRVWSWGNGDEPADIKNGAPDPSKWGSPIFALTKNNCDITRAFKNLRLVLNIDFCGDAAGQDGLWKQACSTLTEEATCVDHVRNNPDAFADVFWEVAYIDVYQLGAAPAPSSSVVAPYPSVSTFSAIQPSSVVPGNPYPSVSTFPAIEPSSSAPHNPYPSVSTFPAIEPSSSAPYTPYPSVSTFSAIAPSSVAASDSAAVTSSAVASSEVVSTSAVASSSAVSSASASGSSEAPGSGSSSTGVPVPGSSGVPVSYGPGATASESETPCTTTDLPVETSTEVPVSTTEYTTSTVYATTTYTVTSCSATVTDCPFPGGSYTTTEVVPISTTICPVEDNTSATYTDVEDNTATYTTDVEEATSTAYDSDSTTTDTTTLSLTTTEYLPVQPTSAPVYPSSGYPVYPGKNTTISIVKPTGGFAPPEPAFTGTYSPEQPEETQPVTAGSAKFGISGLVIVAAAAVVFL